MFTLWAPPGWSTAQGLRIGEPLLRLEATYPGWQHVRCSGYAAYALTGAKASSVVYVSDGEVWGFGLVRSGRSICI